MPDRTGLPLSPGDPVRYFASDRSSEGVSATVLAVTVEERYLIMLMETLQEAVRAGIVTDYVSEPFLVDGARLEFFGGNSR
jgi:hypothetical protein